MSQDENLRLIAEIVDKFSGPLRQLRQGIQSINSGPGVQRVKTDLQDVGRHVGNVAGAIRNTLVPALSAAGLAGLSLGAGLAGVSTVFANATARMSHLSHQTGVTIQVMRELSALAPRIGIDESAIQSGLNSFSAAFDQIKKRQGETYAELYRKAPQLAEAIVGSKTIDEAVSNALSFLAGVAREKGPAQARLWSQLLFGNEDLAAVGQLGRDGLRKALEEIRRNIGSIDPQAVATSRAFEKAMLEMRETATGLRDAIGAEVLPIITELAKGARSFFDENKVAIKDGIVGFIRDVKDFRWGDFFGGIREAAKAINEFVQSIGGWKVVLIGLVALKGISLAAPVLALAAAVTKLGVALTVLPLAKLASMVGLMSAGSLAAGAAALAAGVAAGIGMTAIAENRSKTLVPETNEELNRRRAQREELARKLQDAERDGLGSNVTGRLRERIEFTDREIKALEDRLAKATEAGMGDGAEKAQPKIERETKTTFQKLKDWLSLSSIGGANMPDGQFGGARIQTAGFGGSAGWAGSGYGAGRYGDGGVGGYGGGYSAGGSGRSGGGVSRGAGRAGEAEGPPADDEGAGNAPQRGSRPPRAVRRRGSFPSVPAQPPYGIAFDAPGSGGSALPSIPIPKLGPAFPNGPILPGRATNDPMLGLIASKEAGRAGYDSTLANGALIGGERKLTSMTLDEIDKMQTEMLKNPANKWNSSAAGRYQIVRTTLRGLRKELSLKGDQLYDEGLQDRLAAQLLARRGRNPAGLRNEWEGLKGVSDARILEAWDKRQRMIADGTLGREDKAGYSPKWPSAWGRGDSKAGDAPAVAGADGFGFDAEKRRLGGKPGPGDLPFRQDSGVELLRKALRSGVTGNAINRVQGDASLRIDLNGFPKGTRTSTEFNGLFKEVSLNRGKSMPIASEEA